MMKSWHMLHGHTTQNSVSVLQSWAGPLNKSYFLYRFCYSTAENVFQLKFLWIISMSWRSILKLNFIPCNIKLRIISPACVCVCKREKERNLESNERLHIFVWIWFWLNISITCSIFFFLSIKPCMGAIWQMMTV